MMQSTCHNCPDRFIEDENGNNCHSVCEKYLKAKKAYEDEIQAFREGRENSCSLLTVGAEQCIRKHERIVRQARARGRKQPK